MVYTAIKYSIVNTFYNTTTIVWTIIYQIALFIKLVETKVKLAIMHFEINQKLTWIEKLEKKPFLFPICCQSNKEFWLVNNIIFLKQQFFLNMIKKIFVSPFVLANYINFLFILAVHEIICFEIIFIFLDTILPVYILSMKFIIENWQAPLHIYHAWINIKFRLKAKRIEILLLRQEYL